LIQDNQWYFAEACTCCDFKGIENNGKKKKKKPSLSPELLDQRADDLFAASFASLGAASQRAVINSLQQDEERDQNPVRDITEARAVFDEFNSTFATMPRTTTPPEWVDE
jgi:hypothetical protein